MEVNVAYFPNKEIGKQGLMNLLISSSDAMGAMETQC